ncbi:MAG: aromatic ring-hydroxylating dioxygenase subunit alpha [Burkholderiales bacterium]|nr:aromatic ring-hydroxylating dioxygenase subunit alpha [Burkholderiales bacterium]
MDRYPVLLDLMTPGMPSTVTDLIAAYDAGAPLERARTIPAAWYTDARMHDLERRAVFAKTWQMVGHTGQVRDPGQYLTAEIGGEPVAVVRGGDGVLRGFFNVCRHHAAAVLTAREGTARLLRCPYHGWSYTLEGALFGVPEFAGVAGFDKRDNGLVPIECATWEQWVFVRIMPGGPSLTECIGADFATRVAALDLGGLRWFERRRYTLDCNWKVYVDNYLDGGYHVPHLHKGLSSVIDNTAYAIEIGERWCEQSSPLSNDGDVGTAAVRRGDRARYWWLYPNFMINAYEGVLDTNLVIPLGPERTEVIFDYWFTDTSPAAHARNLESIAVSERIQDEDVAICASVQRGLRSRAYEAGRLSVRREAGEWLFHRLLHGSLADGAA